MPQLFQNQKLFMAPNQSKINGSEIQIQDTGNVNLNVILTFC